MEIREYQNLADREITYFWHVGRREILHEAIERHSYGVPSSRAILDVGCGTGGNMLLLKDYGSVTGIDFSDEAIRLAQGKGFATLCQADATKLPFDGHSFDLATSLDVLEHIPGDEIAIGEVYRVLRKNGLFVVTVPAYQWLFSQHDVALHHMRRYTKKEMTNKLKAAGFEIQQASYFVMLGVFMNGLRKVFDMLRRTSASVHTYDVVYPDSVNTLLLSELRLEKKWLRFFPLPFGTSIFVVAKKV